MNLQSATRQVHRMSLAWRISLYVGGSIALAATVPLIILQAIQMTTVGTNLEDVLTLMSVVFAGCSVMLLLYAANHTRIIISPQGIEYHRIGYSIRTTWDNIERIDLIGKWLGGVECFVLRQPALQGNQWVARLTTLAQPDRIIPLGEFGWWRYGNLGKEVKQYAPHLFV